MRGTKFTNRIYFSKDGNKLIITEDPLPIANQNLILKGKMIRRKKTYKTPLINNRVTSMNEISPSPVKPKEEILFGSGTLKKDGLRIQSRMATYDILSYLKTKCTETYHKTQANFMNPYESRDKQREKERDRETHSQSGKIGVPIRRMQTTQSRFRLSNHNIEHKSIDLSPSEVASSEMVQAVILSKSQSPIRPKIGMKNYTNPINLIKIPKIETKMKLLVMATKPVINKNKPLLSINPLEIKHVRSQSYAMIEADSQQLVLINRGKQSLEIASITKIMTAYLIITMVQKRNIDIKTQMVQVDDFVERISGTSAELIHGDIYNIEQLLYGLLLPSGNDAALVLADWAGAILNNQASKVSQYKENINAFVQQMTKTARQLGLKDTRYGNPHGLPHPQGKSTAIDQCKLASICMKIPLFNQIVKCKQYQFQLTDCQGIKRTVLWQNTNKLLRREGFIGLKTGITVTAGPCLISAYEFKSKTYILTVLRSNKISRRFKDTRKILHWALMKLYQGNTYFEQSKQLQELNKNKKQLDSDYSEDENEFVYGQQGSDELSKRVKILTNQL